MTTDRDDEPVGFLNAQGGFLLTDSGASWLKGAIAATKRDDLPGQPAVAVFANPPAPSASMGRVRELEWRQPSGPWAFVADALGITYRLSQGIGDDTSWELRLHNSLIGTYPSKDDGLKAGQRDFERLVSQWLDSPPDHGGGEGLELLATMATHLGWELDWGPRDPNDEEGEYGWRVHDRRGNRSDLEWTLIGFGASPADALRAALRSQP